MTALFTGVFSIVPTRRRRFLWAAWWTAPTEADPFRRPDASSGGARSREEAWAQAERAAGRTLVKTDACWAGAWARVLRGEPPWPKPGPSRPPGSGDGPGGDVASASAAARSTGSRRWALGVLGLQPGATASEIRRAFRVLALRTHPDRGGSEAAFVDVKQAYDIALAAAQSPRRRRRA